MARLSAWRTLVVSTRRYLRLTLIAERRRVADVDPHARERSSAMAPDDTMGYPCDGPGPEEMLWSAVQPAPPGVMVPDIKRLQLPG
jgi:hypothetical protein